MTVPEFRSRDGRKKRNFRGWISVMDNNETTGVECGGNGR
jgi:hypothetical protein